MSSRYLQLAGILLLAATAACHDAPTQPAAPSPTPTPAPAVKLDLNGKWTGTIEYDPSGEGGCPVRETFETTVSQNEGAVYLEVPTQCFRTIYIYGTLALDRSRANLSTHMLLGNDIEVASMSGTATNSQIDASTHSRGRGYPISLNLKR